MNLKESIIHQAKLAKTAAREMARCKTSVKNSALIAMANALEEKRNFLIEENTKDLEVGKHNHLSAPMIERLTLTSKRITEMAIGLREVSTLPDPVGQILGLSRRENGMQVGQMRSPIGLIGIIYESRPNVTADTTALCVKSGNAVILRGGSEAIHSNKAIASILIAAGEAAGLPRHFATLIETTDRSAILEMLELSSFIDLIIPRGGEALMQMVTQHAKMPVMKHDKGVCHTFVDATASMEMAQKVAINAKAQRPGTCNAMETLLIHQAIAPRFLPIIAKGLQEANVSMRVCPKTWTILTEDGFNSIAKADESDWQAEYLDLILAVKVVDDMEEAMAHIAQYGSGHSEAIITNDHDHAMRFLNEVDASAVFVNASTRLNDGGQLGLGAEMGISTSRIHARGPMGLEALTCPKFIILGEGQIRQ
ncbi:MAG: glutamate-5-semialdehyde dehydrogenase [Nitrospirota bacterium]